MKNIKIKTAHGIFEAGRMAAKHTEKKKKWEPRNPKCVYSFIPGTVVEINVKKRRKVKKGDVMMLFNAMKMDNVIIADRDGKIKAVNVKVGESVPKNKVMIEFE